MHTLPNSAAIESQCMLRLYLFPAAVQRLQNARPVPGHCLVCLPASHAGRLCSYQENQRVGRVVHNVQKNGRGVRVRGLGRAAITPFWE